MPSPLLLATWGHAALAASKHAAVKAACSANVYELSSATLAYILARLAWNNVPDFIKEDVAVRNLLPRRKSEVNESRKEAEALELSNLASVIEKLHALLVSGSDHLVEPIPYLHASILAYIQLAAQLRRLHPSARDEWYTHSGDVHFPNDGEIADLRRLLDFAVLAYESNTDALLKELGSDFEILQHNTMLGKVERPGYVGHYTAFSKEQKIVVVGIRGTSTFQDFLTDSCGRAVSYYVNDDLRSSHYEEHARVEVRAEQPNEIMEEDMAIEVQSGHERIWIEDHQDSEDSHIRCHEGILISAKRLANIIQPLIESYIVKEGYRLILTGHSLGAGCAALTAVVIRSRLPPLLAESDCIRVYAFAPPPVLDYDTAMAASSYTYSVVNNCDIIPRTCLSNLKIFHHVLRSVSERLECLGLAPTNPASTAAFLRKLSKGMDDNDLIMTQQEVQIAIRDAHQIVELRNKDNLYVPGRVFILFEPSSVIGPSRQDESGTRNFVKTPDRRCVVSNGASPVLRFLEIDMFRMLTDHITASYYSSLEKIAP